MKNIYNNPFINSLLRDCLDSRFRLFDSKDQIRSLVTLDQIYIRYFTWNKSENILRTSTHFDIEVSNDICYLLDIEIDKSKRGKGYGWQLYSSIHDFSSRLGLSSVRQTPSGNTFNGESRRDYLLKRGYLELSNSILVLPL